MIYEYRAEAYMDRPGRREIFAFRVPARFVQVGESIYVGYTGIHPDGIELPTDEDVDLKKVRKIEHDDVYRVTRFKVGWLTWTPWGLDEDEVYVEAMRNPIYTRGARRHEYDDAFVTA